MGWYLHDQVQTVPDGTTKLREEVAYVPTAPTPAVLPHRSSLSSANKTQAWSTEGSACVPPQSGQLQHSSPFLKSLGRTVVRRSLTGGRNSEQRSWLVPLLGRRNGQASNSILTYRLWPVVWLDGKGRERIQWGNYWWGNLRTRSVERPLWMGKTQSLKKFVS